MGKAIKKDRKSSSVLHPKHDSQRCNTSGKKCTKTLFTGSGCNPLSLKGDSKKLKKD